MIDKSQTTAPPTLHSGIDWHVGATAGNGDTEIRIVLRSTTEAMAWIEWLFDNCGQPDPAEMEPNNG